MIVVNKINDVKGYDKFAEKQGVNIFYNKFWLEFLDKNEKDPIYFYESNNEGITSFLGLSRIGDNYYCMPWFVSEKIYFENSIESYIKEFNKLKCSAVIIENISKKQAKILSKKGFIVYPSYVYPELEVSSMGGFWSGLGGAKKRKVLKKAIRKAKDEGLEIVNVTSLKDVESYFMLERKTMERNNSIAESLDYWKGIYENVPSDKLLFLLAKKNGKVIAGRISVVDENKIFNLRGVSLREFQSCHANELLHLRIIEEAINRGIPLIDYGASTISHSGSYVFKKKFSNKERFLWSATYVVDNKVREKYLEIAKRNKKRLDIFLNEDE